VRSFFGKKSYKNSRSVGDPPANHRWLPTDGTGLELNTFYYYYRKRTNVTTANVLLLLLPRFCIYFHFQTLWFLVVGAQKYVCPRAQGTLATPLLWELRNTTEIDFLFLDNPHIAYTCLLYYVR